VGGEKLSARNSPQLAEISPQILKIFGKTLIASISPQILKIPKNFCKNVIHRPFHYYCLCPITKSATDSPPTTDRPQLLGCSARSV
jgi:hypothetical protein